MTGKKLSLPIKFFDISEVENDKRFLRLKLYAISVGEHNNNGEFTLESIEKAIPTVPLTPILVHYDKYRGDATSHEMNLMKDGETGEEYYEFIERIVGVVPEKDPKITIEEINGKTWLCYEAVLFCNYAYLIKKMLLKSKTKKISVEIEVIKSTIDPKTEYEVIEEFLLHGTTVLGNHIKSGVADAHLNVLDGLEVSKSNVLKFSQDLNKELTKFNSEHSEQSQLIKKSIKLSLTKNSASNSAWSMVDKTKLRNDILEAENKTELVNACYLVVQEGWEDKPSELLKYPTCQIKNDTLVYNINGVQNAHDRLEQQKNESYYSSANTKLMKIYKKLGLVSENSHMKFQEGGTILMKEKLIALFETDNKYKYLSSNDKLVTVFSVEDKKFVIIPFELKEDTIVMEEDKAKDAEVFAKPIEDSEDEPTTMACNEEMAEIYAEVDSTKKELEAKDSEMIKMETEKVEMEAKVTEFETKFAEVEKEKETYATEKVEMEATIANMESEKNFAMEEIKKYKTIQFNETLKDLTKQYKLSTGESKEWESKFESFASIDELETAIVMDSHKKQKQFSQETHINMGKVNGNKEVEKKRAVDRIKENLK